MKQHETHREGSKCPLFIENILKVKIIVVV